MRKFLLMLTLMVVSLGVNAQTKTLWQSDDAAGVLVEWGQPCYTMSADALKETFKPGDYVVVTVSGVVPENQWPQVALQKAAGGWPPLANSGVGGQTYPCVVEFPITYGVWETISTEGLQIHGDGAYVSKVESKVGPEISENTVWFGEKVCGWGNGVSIPASVFAKVHAGDQLKFWTSDQSFQILLGGWSSLNMPAYDGSWANKETVDGVTTVTMIEDYETTNSYPQDGKEKEFNVFELLKANGAVMHGTTTITRIDYIPAPVDIEIAPASGDITESLNAAKAEVNKVGDIIISLAEGGSYTVSAPLEATGSILIDGNGATIDASGLNGALIQMGANPVKTIIEKEDGTTAEANGQIVDVVKVQNVTVNNLPSYIYSDGGKAWIINDFSIENSVIKLNTTDEALKNKALINATGYGIVSNLIAESTLYNVGEAGAAAKYLIQYNNAARADRMGADSCYVIQRNNTFYNTWSTGGQIANYNAMNDYTSFTVVNNIYVGMPDIARRIVGKNMSTKSSHLFRNNTYQKADGTYDNASNYDKSGTAIECNPGFKDAANGDFTLSAVSHQAAYQTGDPRWLVEFDAETAAAAAAEADMEWFEDLSAKLTAVMTPDNYEYITADNRQAAESFMGEYIPGAIQGAYEDAVENKSVYETPFSKSMYESQVKAIIDEINDIKEGKLPMYTENGVVGDGTVNKGMPFFNTAVGVEVYAVVNGTGRVVVKGWDGVEGSDLQIAYTKRSTLEEGQDSEPQIAILGIEQTVDGEVVSEYVEDEDDPMQSYVSLVPAEGSEYVAAMVYPFNEMSTVIVGKDDEAGMGVVSLYGTWAKMPQATEPAEGELDPGFGIPELETVEAAYMVQWPGERIPLKVYDALAETVKNSEWGDLIVEPRDSIAVEVYDNKTVFVRAIGGVEGYDMKVAFDEDDNVTAITPIVKGKESETVTSGYATIYTAADNYIQAYLADGYCYAGEEDGEGYVLLSAYNKDQEWGVYYIEWPMSGVKEVTLAELVQLPAREDKEQKVIVTLNKAVVTATFDVEDVETYRVAFIEEADLENFQFPAAKVIAAGIEAGKALTGEVIGTWVDNGNGAVLVISENNCTAEDATVEATNMSAWELAEPMNLNRLVVVENNMISPIGVVDGVLKAGDATIYDLYNVLGENYQFPENIESVTGVLVQTALDNLFLVPRSAKDIKAAVAVPENVKYLWTADAEGNVKEYGGTAVANEAAAGRVNYANGAYFTISLNGKKDFSTGYITVNLNEALVEGDVIKVTAYKSKGDASKKSGALFRFNGTEATYSTGDVFNDIVDKNPEFVSKEETPDVPETLPNGLEPNTIEFTVTAAMAGATSFDMTRCETGTNLFITYLEISANIAQALPGDDSNAIHGVNADSANDVIYNIKGQKVDANYKGIVIKNGKKVMVK